MCRGTGIISESGISHLNVLFFHSFRKEKCHKGQENEGETKGKVINWGKGPNSGGGEGFESGGERHTSTQECSVLSNPPHSQGVANFNFHKKNAHSGFDHIV